MEEEEPLDIRRISGRRIARMLDELLESDANPEDIKTNDSSEPTETAS